MSQALIIFRQLPSVDRAKDTDTLQLTFEELKERILRDGFLKHLFRYRKVRMICPQIGTIQKPLKSTIFLLYLSPWDAAFEQENGDLQKITAAFFLRRLRLYLRDLARLPALFREARRHMNEIKTSVKTPSTRRMSSDPALSAVYLRTDPIYGLKSGGSVAHISGVLNNLSHEFADVYFLTTDAIPMVSAEIKTRILTADLPFSDFAEPQMLHLNREFEEFAKIHLHHQNIGMIYQRASLFNYFGCRLARRRGIPFVLEYNGSEIWVSQHWGGKRLRHQKIALDIEDLNFREADLIVVVSDVLRTQLQERGVADAKILVNPNGVDPQLYSPDIDGGAIRQKYGLTDKTVLGFIGTFGRWHGAELLIEAFAQLLQEHPAYRDSLRLLMVGDGMTMGEVKRRIAQHRLEECCILTGTVAQQQGPNYLAACDILVSPHIPNVDGSKFFGSPTKLFEYMAMGKGIVAANLEQIGEILTHDQTAWMTQPGNSSSLKDGLKILIEDRPLRERLGGAARRRAVEKHTWKSHCDRILERVRKLS